MGPVSRACLLLGACAAAVRLSAAEPWGTVLDSSGSPIATLSRTDARGAVLSDGELDANAAAVRFVPGTVRVGRIELADRALTFFGEGTTLASDGGEVGMFRLDGADAAHRWTFRDIAFEGPAAGASVPHDGGAIDCRGGGLSLIGCSFAGLCARFSGGAVNAVAMDGDVVVSNCTFLGNSAGPLNGLGGAIYASGAAEGPELLIADSRFTGNRAENGGAIATFHVWSEAEVPLAVRIVGATELAENAALYQGGAVYAEGPFAASGSNVLFRANVAGNGGGALAVNGIEGLSEPVGVTLADGVTFARNRVVTNVTWTAGGAVCVMKPGCRLDVCRAVFSNNTAKTEHCGEPAYGGAVYTAEDCTNEFRLTAFVGNDAGNSGKSWCFGGAVSAAGGRMTIDTCVFDSGEEPTEKCYGNAIDFEETETLILNSTFRRGRVEAVSAYNGTLSVTNSVLVGNGAAGDLFVEGTTVLSMGYSAYGGRQLDVGVTVTADDFNLADRRANDVYDGDTLRLRGAGFNPVAGLGLVQPGVTDFADVGYGTKAYGYSMGAYETPTEKLVVRVDGEKTFDGTATSNGCRWTWGMYTNEVGGAAAVWTDLGDPRKALALASWTFGQAQAGEYASTNEPPSDIVASVVGKSSRISWLMTLVDTFFTGRILPEHDIVSWLEPVEYPWTGDEIRPGEAVPEQVIVSNRTQIVLLVPGRDYTLAWADNVDATNAAKVIVTCCGDYSGVFTNLFLITSYLVAYYQAGEPVGGVDRFGAVTVSNAVADVAKRHPGDGWCVDVQHSRTNGWVYVYDPTRDEPQLVLTVRYEADANGDDVPDIYQKRVLFAVVNGLWNAEEGVAGRDIVRWVTLTDPGTGLWAANGTGVLTDVPGVGVRNASGYAPEDAAHRGVWNTEDGRSPLGLTVSRETTFPIYLYAYPRADKPRKARESADVRLLAAAAGDPTSVLRNQLVVSSFSVDGESGVSGSVKAQVVDGAGEVRAETVVDGAVLDVLGAERPGGEWKVLSEVLTDGGGAWGVGRHRLARFFKVRLRSAQ